jgi:hypothetical protein
MNEQQWLSCTDPTPMLAFLQGKAGNRKHSLFTVACCRRVEHLLTADYVRGCLRAIDTRQRYADGLASEGELQTAGDRAFADALDAAGAIAHPGDVEYYATSCAAEAVERAGNPDGAAVSAAHAAGYEALARTGDATVAAVAAGWEGQRWLGRSRWDADEAAVAGTPAYLAAYAAERAAQAALLRCLFGNPFRPLASRPFPAGIVGLARAIRDGDQALYPVLADALQDVGEVSAADHCRGPLHARGCHVVDGLAGKS